MFSKMQELGYDLEVLICVNKLKGLHLTSNRRFLKPIRIMHLFFLTQYYCLKLNLEHFDFNLFMHLNFFFQNCSTNFNGFNLI